MKMTRWNLDQRVLMGATTLSTERVVIALGGSEDPGRITAV